MTKTHIPAMAIFAACILMTANVRAQQTPAANPPVTPPAKSTTSPATKAPAAKTGAAATAKAPAKSPMTLTTPKDKASYGIGLNIGKGMHKDAIDIDPNILFQGFKDGFSGNKQLISDDEIKAVLTALQAHVRQMQDDRTKQLGETNKKEGEAFLAANKAKPGVVTLPDGLQYKIITPGTGPKPEANDTVICNYRGTFIDGTEFDSSAKTGKPATFNVSQVIHGWTEALQLMPSGSKWQLFVPSEMAYGTRGASTLIGPNAVLIFDVELLSIQSKGAAPAPATPAPSGTQ
jgi:FKBP-type peptidyl-prolyl cis-trans isomerase FklB